MWKFKAFSQQIAQGPIVKNINFQDDPLENLNSK